MPSLDWIGKSAVVNHAQQVPYRLLRCDPERSVGEPGSGNLLVEGDNLQALKALLPYYAGQVKCIYIDPPYNTGNEKWVYNDAVNSPEMRAWLGQVVGAEAEDLSRHDKWLCMMYPRLVLLRQMLRPDGAIFVSIDDNEVAHLRAVMDETFGARNFVATVVWQKVYSPKNSARHFSEDHDFVVVYARDAERWTPRPLARSDKQDNAYKNRDDDPRGPWKTSDLSARNFYGLGTYAIKCPSGRVVSGPPKGMYWRVSEAAFYRLVEDGRIWWGVDGGSIPQTKRFLSEVKQGVVPQTLWKYEDVGHTQEAKKELLSICDFADSGSVFITPKPVRLLRRVLEIASDPDSIVMDAFAGSGTTGHAVLALNREDGGHRRFVLVEMDQKICSDVTAQRLRRAAEGYTPAQGGKAPVLGLGGGFRYCRLGDELLDGDGRLPKAVSFAELARHVYFSETGEPLAAVPRGRSPLLGVCGGTGYYLLYNGILGDRRPAGGNVLTAALLDALPAHDGPKIIFGEGCRLGEARLRRAGVAFKHIPYQVPTS